MLKLKVGIVFCLLVSIINGQIFKINHREPVISERSLLSYGARFNMTSGISITGRNVTRIEDNAFAKFQNLSSLSLDSTNISRITTRSFSGLRRLEFLQIIDSQNLNEIPANVFTELRLLKVLNLAINNISLIYPDSFNGLDTLIDLYLAGNSILNFPREAFRGCRNIRGDMYLIGQKGTRPMRIDPLAFTGLTLVKTIDLSDNRIETLARNTFSQNVRLDRQELFKTLQKGNNIDFALDFYFTK